MSKRVAMAESESVLAVIKSGFSDQREVIEREFNASEDFRSLCEEYEQCASAASHWKKSKSPQAARREQEYSELLLELQEEITSWLEDLA